MVLQEIGGGYDYVQSTEPSNPSIGETWLDTSSDPPVGKVYADLGGGGQWTTVSSVNSSEKTYDIQKNGTDGEGIINFKTK